MAAHDSPGRQPPAGKRAATAGTWRSPDRLMAEAPADPTPETIVMCNDKVRVFKRNKNRRRAPKRMGWDFSFRLRSDGPLHKRSTTMSARTMDAVWWGRGPWRPPGTRRRLTVDRQRVSIDTTQPSCKQERAGCRRTTLALSSCHWPRAHAELSEWRGWWCAPAARWCSA